MRASPTTLRETDEGLHVAGRLDLEDSDLAREAWRSVKAGRIGLSFGYLAKRSRNRKGGGRELLELDVFEVSLTPAPINADTRIVSFKGGRPLQLASFEAWRKRRRNHE